MSDRIIIENTKDCPVHLVYSTGEGARRERKRVTLTPGQNAVDAGIYQRIRAEMGRDPRVKDGKKKVNELFFAGGETAWLRVHAGEPKSKAA